MDDQMLIGLVEKVAQCTARLENAADRLDNHEKAHEELEAKLVKLQEDHGARITDLEKLKWKAFGAGSVIALLWGIILKFV